MGWPFDDATRRNILARCAAFTRLPASEPALGLKRAAVAIALVEADDGAGGTALLLTLRAAGLPGFDASLYYGLAAPAGTPRPIIDKLARSDRTT